MFILEATGDLNALKKKESYILMNGKYCKYDISNDNGMRKINLIGNNMTIRSTSIWRYLKIFS